MNKGFTLIELLAVIIVLSLISALAVPTVINQLAKNKTKASEATKQLIFSGADLYEQNNHMPSGDGIINCVTLQQIVDSGYLEDPIIDGMSGKEMDLNLYVKIQHSYNFNSSQYDTSYELVNKCESSQIVCHAVTKTTSGNVPEGKFAPGDEYLCEVKDDTWYTFFVLSVEGEKVNLIMDSNVKIDGTPIKSDDDISLETLTSWSTAWLARKDQKECAAAKECSDFVNFPSSVVELDNGIKMQCPVYGNCYTNSEYSSCNNYQKVFEDCSKACSTYEPSNGPVTAINFLNKATFSWVNIPKLNEKYTDQGGKNVYENFELTGRARLPKVKEIEPLFEEGFGHLGDNNIYATNKLPNWATNYLYPEKPSEKYPEKKDREGRKTLLNVSAYWLMDIYYSNKAYAYDVGDDTDAYGRTTIFFDGKDGFGQNYGCKDKEGNIKVYPSPGVRPVISIYKANISN